MIKLLESVNGLQQMIQTPINAHPRLKDEIRAVGSVGWVGGGEAYKTPLLYLYR